MNRRKFCCASIAAISGVWMFLLALVNLTRQAPGADKNVPAGFTRLFNGRDLTGWKTHGGDADAWRAENGRLIVARPARQQADSRDEPFWLMTEKEYGDFELRLEFNVPADGNSGVALRAPLRGDPSKEGMEIQILDDNAPRYKNLAADRYTGSIYGVVAPSERASKAASQWNRLRIICQGPKVTIDLNGTQIVNADLDTLETSHGKTHPGLKRDTGHLGVQSHDGRVQFRNLLVKELR